jgi:hypothetical protein
MLVKLVDRIPVPAPPRQRGHPRIYSDRLFLKALVIMIVRHVAHVHALLSILAEPTPEMQTLRALLAEQGRFPCRRTFERRLAALPATLPAQIGCLGRSLVTLLGLWQAAARAAAIDSTVLRSLGGVWHKKDREAGLVPHSSIDTAAGWTKSGWPGWVYGWKLHVVCAVGAVWLPLAAALTPAPEADNTVAPALLRELPLELRFLLGDQHYRDPALDALCALRNCQLVVPRGGPYPHTDAGVEVRRLLHKTRSLTMENLNEQFKGIFAAHQQVPTRGLVATQRFALGALLVYQLSLLLRFHQGADLRVGLKAFVKAA